MASYAGKLVVENGSFSIWTDFMLLDGDISFTLTGKDDTGDFDIEGLAHLQADGSYTSPALPITREDTPQSDGQAVVRFDRVDQSPQNDICKVAGCLQQQEGSTWTFRGKLHKYKHINLQRKARKILYKFGCDRPYLPGTSAYMAMANFEQAFAGEYPATTARDIAFHLTDWQADAILLLAIQWFPEHFKRDEIRRAAGMFLSHAPNHIAAAAKLYGTPVTDVFGIGAIDGDDDE